MKPKGSADLESGTPRFQRPTLCLLRIQRAFMDVSAEKNHVRTPVPARERMPASGAAPVAPRRRSAREIPRAWNLSLLAGRFTEVSDSGASPALTAAAVLLLQAHPRGGPAAWIGLGNSM